MVSCKILNFPNLAGKIWKVQILAGKIWKIQDLARDERFGKILLFALLFISFLHLMKHCEAKSVAFIASVVQ